MCSLFFSHPVLMREDVWFMKRIVNCHQIVLGVLRVPFITISFPTICNVHQLRFIHMSSLFDSMFMHFLLAPKDTVEQK